MCIASLFSLPAVVCTRRWVRTLTLAAASRVTPGAARPDAVFRSMNMRRDLSHGPTTPGACIARARRLCTCACMYILLQQRQSRLSCIPAQMSSSARIYMRTRTRTCEVYPPPGHVRYNSQQGTVRKSLQYIISAADQKKFARHGTGFYLGRPE